MSLTAATYNTVLGLRKRTWTSGMTVKQYEVVKSPADGEDYERITATGSGTTDPADDTTNYKAYSYDRTSAIPAGRLVSVTGASITNHFAGSTKVSLGAIAVGARTSALSITGRGAIDFLGTIKAAGGTWRVEIILDGRVVHDETISITNAQAQLLIGSSVYGGGTQADIALPLLKAVQFKRSFQVYVTAVATVAGSGCGVAYIARSDA